MFSINPKQEQPRQRLPPCVEDLDITAQTTYHYKSLVKSIILANFNRQRCGLGEGESRGYSPNLTGVSFLVSFVRMQTRK